ncbi:response regulator [Myroides pelagicus]|uniref:Response regulator n=1 Tax=Myroides pelagicus TaxID=270914 RepID=A0A7K1GJU9_9FLAO|nr:response regulator [Myroides pelagicus]MEC4112883.1 response regulator [Myroides pelagicus]MTH28693.1 response regulator [Myroides pelagicus]
MFKKILIVEDYDSINIGIAQALTEKMPLAEVYNTKYCDDAWLKIQSALANNAPFDLIISDLSFQEDYRDAKLKGGADLISTIRETQPLLKIIVYSIENRYIEIHELIDHLKVNAFVSKGRNSIQELLTAIKHIQQEGNMVYLSPDIKDVKSSTSSLILQDDDLLILRLLSEGYSQNDVGEKLKEENYTITSTSSIEKRISKLRATFDAKNTIHLISIVKDLGII